MKDSKTLAEKLDWVCANTTPDARLEAIRQVINANNKEQIEINNQRDIQIRGMKNQRDQYKKELEELRLKHNKEQGEAVSGDMMERAKEFLIEFHHIKKHKNWRQLIKDFDGMYKYQIESLAQFAEGEIGRFKQRI